VCSVKQLENSLCSVKQLENSSRFVYFYFIYKISRREARLYTVWSPMRTPVSHWVECT